MAARPMAESFFSEREVIPPSLSALFNATSTGRLVRSIPGWANRNVLPGRPGDRLRYYYRGHADASWSLSSTLYRVVQGVGVVTERLLTKAESAVVREMRNQGLGHRMTDGELLMVLQHHQIPTRLIDFCRSQLTALYFATDELDSRDGRIFVIGQRIDDRGEYPKIVLDKEKVLPWQGTIRNTQYVSQVWSNTVACVEDAPLDPRMRAQMGCFLVGGLARRFGGDNLTIGGRVQPATVWPQVSTLRVFFPMPDARKSTSTRWPAIGWTVRVPARWKDQLREQLKEKHYTRDYMYPDFDGCRRLGSWIAREAAGN
jgi:hypothetical protein